jgi:hypothetical protein
MHDTILRDILTALQTQAKESKAERDDPANAREHRIAARIANRRIGELHIEAEHAFGTINGWRTDASYYFPPERLGRPHHQWEQNLSGWRDHSIYYKAPRHDGKRGFVNIAIVGHPYGLAPSWANDLHGLISNGYQLHVPPAGAYASIWYPGATLFLVLTLPGITVRWLPEQQNAVAELAPTDDAASMQEVAALLAAGKLDAYCAPWKGARRTVTLSPVVSVRG